MEKLLEAGADLEEKDEVSVHLHTSASHPNAHFTPPPSFPDSISTLILTPHFALTLTLTFAPNPHANTSPHPHPTLTLTLRLILTLKPNPQT